MHFWYQYHTNWYQYQHAIFAGFERNFNLGARERSSFDHHFGTSTTLTGTSTNMRSLQDLSGISILVHGNARLLITTLRSLMRIVFKPALG